MDIKNTPCYNVKTYYFLYVLDEPYASAATARCSDEFINYYKKFLSSKSDSTLLQTLYSDFNVENYAECINGVLKVNKLFILKLLH